MLPVIIASYLIVGILFAGGLHWNTPVKFLEFAFTILVWPVVLAAGAGYVIGKAMRCS